MLSDLVEEIGPLMGPSDVCKIYSEVWPCNKNRIFYSPVDVQHSAACCPGDCAQHPLLRGIVLQMRHEMIRGGSRWGDEIMKALEQAIANETPEERAARVAKEAAADEKSYNGIVTYSTKKKADKWCTKSGQMKFRVARPCKYASLFEQRICASEKCGKKVPEGKTKCSCGEILAGCWSHEKTQSCIYVHPDEEQWEAACNGTLCFDRVQQMFHLKTEPLAAPNRFVQVAKNAREEPKRSGHSRPSSNVYESSTFAEKPKPRQRVVESAW